MDPNGDTLDYFELELNALNTPWDLFLSRPYRRGGAGLHGFDFAGLKTAVHLDGTLNDGTDVDRGWTVEVAIPWTAFNIAPRPKPGQTWRVNFSRRPVAVSLEKTAATSRRAGRKTTGCGRPRARIAMHMPEKWGVVEFVR